MWLRSTSRHGGPFREIVLHDEEPFSINFSMITLMVHQGLVCLRIDACGRTGFYRRRRLAEVALQARLAWANTMNQLETSFC